MAKQLEAKFYAAGVVDFGDHCERIGDDEAQFWTVYERLIDGTSQAICDCDSRAGADAATNRLNELAEIANDYGMKFQKSQDALKHAVILNREASPLAAKLPVSEIPTNENFWSAVNDVLYQTEREAYYNVQLGRSDAKNLANWLSEILPLRTVDEVK